MAVREFHGVIHNLWDNPVIRTADEVDGGQWQDPWFPSKVPGGGRIESSQSGEWRSESDGIATGTSGWARWAARVVDPFEVPPEHFEWFQVNWSVPFLGKPNLTWGTSRNDPGRQERSPRSTRGRRRSKSFRRQLTVTTFQTTPPPRSPPTSSRSR